MKSMDCIQREVIAELFHAGNRWCRIVEQAFHQYGITEARAAPLLSARRLGGGVKQIDLARDIGIKGPSLVRLLDCLATTGLIERRTHPDDRRAKAIWLTMAGETLVLQVEELLSRTRADVLGRLNRDELTTALRVFRAFEAVRPPPSHLPGTMGA